MQCYTPEDNPAGNHGRENDFTLAGLTLRSKEAEAHRAQEGTTCGGTPHGRVQIAMVLIGVHTLALLLLTSGPGQVTLNDPLNGKGGTHRPPWVNCYMFIETYLTGEPAFSEKALRPGQPSKSKSGCFFFSLNQKVSHDLIHIVQPDPHPHQASVTES